MRIYSREIFKIFLEKPVRVVYIPAKVRIEILRVF